MTRALARWRVVPLDGKAHDRAGFACGAAELDGYLRRQATQDIRRDVARVFVALPGDGPTIVGYYSLSAASVRKEGLPEAQARRLPHYPVPAALIGRLAVDIRVQGQGLGAHLLMDALYRIHNASQVLAVHAVVVEARDGAAAGFYGKFGFLPFQETPRRLFLPLATIRHLIEG